MKNIIKKCAIILIFCVALFAVFMTYTTVIKPISLSLAQHPKNQLSGLLIAPRDLLNLGYITTLGSPTIDEITGSTTATIQIIANEPVSSSTLVVTHLVRQSDETQMLSETDLNVNEIDMIGEELALPIQVNLNPDAYHLKCTRIPWDSYRWNYSCRLDYVFEGFKSILKIEVIGVSKAEAVEIINLIIYDAIDKYSQSQVNYCRAESPHPPSSPHG